LAQENGTGHLSSAGPKHQPIEHGQTAPEKVMFAMDFWEKEGSHVQGKAPESHDHR
jgi:hypothetical protein